MPRLPAGSRSRAPWRADLRRSRQLFSDFRVEQTDPARFYGARARDSVGQLSGYLDLAGATMLDVGGGPGFFRDAFQAAGATYWALDADVGELSGQGDIAAGTVIGDGMRLPFRDDAVDLCYSSNVLEHVPDPWRMAEEMLRVTRPGGVAFISYTLLVRTVGWPRDRALAFPRRCPSPSALRRQARARTQEQVRRVAVRGHREAGDRLGAPTAARRGPRRDPALQPELELLPDQGARPFVSC